MASIDAMKDAKTKLGTALQNAIQAKNQYQNDKFSEKFTGLDKVIAFQKLRIQLMEEAIAKL